MFLSGNRGSNKSEPPLRDLYLSELAKYTRDELESAVRERVQTVYLGQGKVLARILGSKKIFLSTSDRGFACHVMLDGFWETWLTLFFLRVVGRGMTVLDVGANFGYYTLLFGDLVGPQGRVVAIEPVPQTAALLEQSVTLNGFAGNTRIVRAAAGNKEGTAFVMVPDGEPKNATVVPGPVEGTIPVATVPVDHLTRNLQRVDVVKVDAEGAEPMIFEGMQETIKRHRPRIILEFNAARYANAGQFIDRMLEHYSRLAFVDFTGTRRETSRDALLRDRFGEDWLLLLEP